MNPPGRMCCRKRRKNSCPLSVAPSLGEQRIRDEVFALGHASRKAVRSEREPRCPRSWVFTYDRSVASRPPANTQIVEHGNDLTGWTQLTIPLNSATNVTITPQGQTDRVQVILPALGDKAFARLKVIQ